ncbi:MAG: hypothetical protein ACKVS7_04410 [Gemmatimonadaceae bacterium]
MKTLASALSPRRRSVWLAALAALTLVAACEDPFEIRANAPNIDATFEVWAITGSPSAYPSGVLLPQATVIRLDAAGSFDLAFDIDQDGRVMVLPVSSVVSPVTGTRQIFFQRTSLPYNSIIDAPRDGWEADSVLLINPGQPFLVRATTQFCQFSQLQDIYARILVDSVILSERRIKMSARVNPNCGFRSFVSGIPPY